MNRPWNLPKSLQSTPTAYLASAVVHVAGFVGLACMVCSIPERHWEVALRSGDSASLCSVSREAVVDAQPLPATDMPLEPVRCSADEVRREQPPPPITNTASSPEVVATAVRMPSARPQPAEPEMVVHPAIPRAMRPAREVGHVDLSDDLAVQDSRDFGAKVDQPPRKLVDNNPPNYPSEALRAGVEGRVLIRAMISAVGRVLKAEVDTSSGSPALDASALAAVELWQFSPAKRGGVPIPCEVVVPVQFRIRRG